MNSSNDNGSAAANPTPSLSELADVPTMDSIDIKIFAEKIDKPYPQPPRRAQGRSRHHRRNLPPAYRDIRGRCATHIREHYYPLDFTLDNIRHDYEFDVSCQGSVPQALEAFFEADGVEDTIRNAVSIGGDSDTIAAIAGAVAEARWGVPDALRAEAWIRLDGFLRETVEAFEARFGAVC